MEGDGRTARPRDFPSREAYRVSRRKFKKLINTPALTKMAVLLARNNEMQIHTTAHIAARYTTGSCADSIARRLVKHFKATASEVYILILEENDRHQFVDYRDSISHEDNIIFINILELIENEIEENFLPLLDLSSGTFERFFNNSELLLSQVRTFYLALAILRILRPAFCHKIIFTSP